MVLRIIQIHNIPYSLLLTYFRLYAYIRSHHIHFCFSIKYSPYLIFCVRLKLAPISFDSFMVITSPHR